MKKQELYDFEIDRIIKEAEGYEVVGLQFPSGLKQYAVGLARRITKNKSTEVIIFTDSTYGGCDTKEERAKLLGIGLLVHFGHNDMNSIYSQGQRNSINSI